MSVSAAGEKSQAYGVRAKKSLGQHFLKDSAIAKKIVDAADPGPDDVVVEVGPGTGALTRLLAERFHKVIAVEIDSRLSDLLKSELSDLPHVPRRHRRHSRTLPTRPVKESRCRESRRTWRLQSGRQPALFRRLPDHPVLPGIRLQAD